MTYMYMQQVCVLIADHIQVSSFYRRKGSYFRRLHILVSVYDIFGGRGDGVSGRNTSAQEPLIRANQHSCSLFFLFFSFCIAFRGGALHDEPKNGCEGDYLKGSKQ